MDVDYEFGYLSDGGDAIFIESGHRALLWKKVQNIKMVSGYFSKLLAPEISGRPRNDKQW